MSTRCQVQVTDGDSKVTLYHHSDGYPSNMLPLIKSAWEKYGTGWEGARVGKVAGMLCAVDVLQFEPLDYHTLHTDIEWYYEVNCKDTMHIGTEPVWTVTTYKARFNFDGKLTKSQQLKKRDTRKVNEITDNTGKILEGI